MNIECLKIKFTKSHEERESDWEERGSKEVWLSPGNDTQAMHEICSLC